MAGGHPQPESINGRRGSQSAVRHTDGMGTGALPFSGKSLLDSLIHLPLVLPPVVVGYLLLISMGRKGIIGEWLYNWFGFSFTFSWRGAALAAAVVAFPLMVRAIRLALEAVDMRLEQAARTLGASPLRVFFTITLPLSLPGIIVGTVLAFARSLGEFGATITFVSNIPGNPDYPAGHVLPA